MPLSDVTVKNAKPAEKPYKLADERGLYLLVNPKGSKLWRLDYRFEGKRKTLALGAYPDVPLASPKGRKGETPVKGARELRDAARSQLAQDIDPGAAKQQEKASKRLAAANSFEAVAREWLGKQKLAPATYGKAQWMLEALTFPWIGELPIAEIDAPKLLSVLRRIESQGKLETAQRVKQQCGRVFRYAIATGRASNDPSAALRGALATPETRHRASITDPAQIGALLRTIQGYTGTFVVACALKLAPLLFVRPGELRHAEWSEFDLTAGEWRIPDTKKHGEGRLKAGGVHIVPLSDQALLILRELQPLTVAGRYVFPGVRGRGLPMSEGTILAALRRLGYSGEEMSGHGFRSMASTRLHEMGWAHDAIERQLAHAERNKVVAAYNYAQHLPERRKMMQAWADYLDALRDERKVVAGNFGRAA